MYAGDFDTAASETSLVIEQEPTFHLAYLPLAMAALAHGDAAGARAEYARMAEAGPAGASLAAIGLADVALYEGRFDEAEAILDVAVTEDQRTGNLSGMAAKYVALAEAYEGQGETARAVEAAERAMSLAGGGGVRALASAVLVRAGEDELPRAAADELSAQLQAQSRAYGRILEGQLALQEGHLVEAVAAFGDAQELADPWLARFGQGVAYVQAGYYAEALAELDLCLRRQGEVTAVLLDDVPSFRYLSPLWYWLGRAQEGVGLTADATDSYQEFLSLRPGDTPDALVDDARQRLARFAAGERDDSARVAPQPAAAASR